MNVGTTEIILLILLLGLAILPWVFFLRTLQTTLDRISGHNRAMPPNQVWFTLIPLFGFIWQFIVVARVADSLQAEFTERKILLDEERPGYRTGITYCILFCCGVLPIIGGFALLAGFVVWVIYWLKIVGYKKRLSDV